MMRAGAANRSEQSGFFEQACGFSSVRSRVLGISFTMAVMCFAVPSPCQQKNTAQQKTFTDPDGAFQFSYPAGFEMCTLPEIERCNHAMIPLCDEHARVCVAYPEKRFAGTTFEGAAFEVRKVLSERERITADDCVTPWSPGVSGGVPDSPEYLISAKEPAKTIGGILFVHGVRGDGAMNQWNSVDVYRTLHGGECFELSVGQAGVNGDVFDPPRKGLTSGQQRSVDASMKQVLESFRFLK